MIDCIFCKIIKGEIPSKPIYQDQDFIVIYDIAPKAPVHVLIIPKIHLVSLQDVSDNETKLMGKMLVLVNKIAKKLKFAQGFKVIINNGQSSGQLVFHLHLHILGGWEKTTHWRV